MKRTASIIGGLLIALGLALPAFADHGTLTAQGNCPTAGKVEANGGNQAAINSTVLPAGTHVCIKGGSADATLITADGVKTLKQLLGNGKDVSHYTIIQTAPTTTTQAPTTTTTVEDTTTTSIVIDDTTTTTSNNETTTTQGETTTTGPTPTTPETTVTTLPFDEVPTTVIESTTTAASAQVVEVATLPYTGFDPVALAGLAAMLGSTGAFLVRKSRR